MNHIRMLLISALAALVGCSTSTSTPGTATSGLGSGAEPTKQKRPNIVLLYADDAGWVDFGFQDQAAEDLALMTPNIDRIASEGVICTRAYMSGVVCSPSRAGMLTGRSSTARSTLSR